MSIVQEALKKAQVNYLKNRVLITRSPIHRIRKRNRSMTIWLIFALCIITMLALALRMFFISGPRDLTGPLMSKESRLAHHAKKTAPASLAKIPVKAEPIVPAKTAVQLQQPVFTLTGVMYLDNKPQAIINGYILEEGDEINGATVMVIDKDYVLLNLKDDKIKVPLKK